VDQLGKLGNRMLQAMAAIAIARRVERCRLSGIRLPEWGIYHPRIPPAGEPTERIASDRLMFLDVDRRVSQLRAAVIQRLEIACYAQHLSNYLPAAEYQQTFPDIMSDVRGLGPRQLLIHIRADENLRHGSPDYTLLPPDFYQEVVRDTGLKPVLMGQTEPNPYMDRLRRALPDAQILPGLDPMRDFATIRRSHNILLSVSTFSWTAAWLSNAERIILPLSGFYNPVQFPEVDLLPLDDPRYEYYLFPINYNIPVERHEPVHRAMAGHWRRVSAPEIDAIRRHFPEVPVNPQKYWDLFDEHYYLAANEAVAEAVAKGQFPNGLEHYKRHGMWERRLPLRFDRVWYGMTYPDAAVETGRGKYVNLLHHYVEAGHAAGYHPAPAPGDPTPAFEPRLP
jgi:hypothetical protein